MKTIFTISLFAGNDSVSGTGNYLMLLTLILFVLLVISVVAVCILSSKLVASRKRLNALIYITDRGDGVPGILSHLMNIFGRIGDEAYSNFKGDGSLRREIEGKMNLKPNRNESLFRDVQNIADLSCNNIISCIKVYCPSLSSNDLDVISMIALGFSAPCIQVICGFTNNVSYYNRRSVIRKKLKVSENLQLEQFIGKSVSWLRNHDFVVEGESFFSNIK